MGLMTTREKMNVEIRHLNISQEEQTQMFKQFHDLSWRQVHNCAKV